MSQNLKQILQILRKIIVQDQSNLQTVKIEILKHFFNPTFPLSQIDILKAYNFPFNKIYYKVCITLPKYIFLQIGQKEQLKFFRSYITRFYYKQLAPVSMGQKEKKIGMTAPPSKNKSKQKSKRLKKNMLCSDSQQEVPQARKRYRKKNKQSDEEQYMIQSQENQQNSENEEWQSDSQQQQQFKDEDISVSQEIHKQKNSKISKKTLIKNSRKKVSPSKSEQKKSKQKQNSSAKKSKPPVQLSLKAMLMNNNKKSIKKTDSFQDFVGKLDVESSQKANKHQKLKQLEQWNDGRDDDQALNEAIRLSKKEAKQQEKNFNSLSNYAFNNNNIKEEKKQQKQQKQQKVDKKINKSKNKRNDKPKKQIKSQNQANLPLSGYQIVFTGQFQPYNRKRLEQLVAQLGGKVPKSLTKKATHLFMGSMPNASSYYNKNPNAPQQSKKSEQAKERGMPIIKNEQLDAFFVQKTGKTLQQHIEQQRKNYMSQIKQKAQKNHLQRTQAKKQRQMTNNQKSHQIWTQKYKPQCLQEVLGQQSQIKQLRQWLQAWHDIHVNGHKRPVKAAFNSFMPSGNINSKAALLSGDAGLGKTTTARLIAKQYGFEAIQYNASQARNKKALAMISKGKDNMKLNRQRQIGKALIIMDEVDGMSSGDRGGIAAIIDMVKNTQVPIICICNDRQSQKIKSLAGYCNDIKFHKPDRRQIVARLHQIILSEGGYTTQQSLNTIVQSYQNDMRQILTYIQYFFKTISPNIVYDTLQKSPNQTKDNAVSINNFQVTRRLLNRGYFGNLKISQRIDLGFIDSDMVPLMVHQNYLSACPKRKLSAKQFHQIVKATQGFVTGDIIQNRIIRTQNYYAMPNKMFMTCAYPTQMACQSLGFPKFTSWLGKFSSQRKNTRLIRQIKNQIGTHALMNTFSAKNIYAPMIAMWIYNHLRKDSPEIEEIISFMDKYSISPTLLNENILPILSQNIQTKFKQISTGNKTKLTKAYNKYHQEVKLKGKKTKAVKAQPTGKYDPVLGQIIKQIMQQQEQPNNQQNSKDVLPKQLEKQKKPTKGKSKKKK